MDLLAGVALAAYTVTVSAAEVAISTATTAAGGGAGGAMTPEHWAVGAASLLLTVLAPALFRHAKAMAVDLPGHLVAMARARWQKKLDRKEVDADLDRLAHKMAWAVAEYAEAKLPNSGMGAERMAMLKTMACSLPFGIGLVVRIFWSEIRDMLEAALRGADAEAKAIAAHGQLPVPALPAPAQEPPPAPPVP